MTLQIRKGRLYALIWFLGGESMNFDLHGALWQDLPSGPWTLTYRFRYYLDNKAHDSDDIKYWYSATAKDDEPDPRAKLAAIFEAMLEEGKRRFPDAVLSRLTPETDDPEVISDLLMKLPWSHPVPTGVGGDA